MKLGLGTVQFGMDYGISNNTGKTPINEVANILGIARKYGVEIIDTAECYGNAEKILGIVGVNDFKVVTKITAFGDLNNSLYELGLKSVYGVLAHNVDELAFSTKFWDKLQEYKKQGLTQKIGVSVYNSQQIDLVLERYDIDLIQVPVNVYDKRLINSGHLKKLKEYGVEIHARSVFLQGLLLTPPGLLGNFFSEIVPLHKMYFEDLKKYQIDPVIAALAFVNNIVDIDITVCGVNTCLQFQDLLRSSSINTVLDYSKYSVSSEKILNPSMWN